VVACMQPDSIKPAARIPNFAFSDDIVYFSNRKPCARGASIGPKRDDSVKPIIVKTSQHSRL